MLRRRDGSGNTAARSRHRRDRMPSMSDYTLVNIKSTENMAEQYGMAPGLESHFPRTPLGLEQSGMAHYRLEPGYRLPFGHSHPAHEEVYVVISGSARIKIEDDVLELGEWDAVRIPPGAMHGFEAGPAGGEMLAFGPHDDEEQATLAQGWWKD
jgi:quercetin dioxygenase-like cupin family protein